MLIGISRKSMVGALQKTQPQQRDELSCGLDLLALLRGAAMIRTHNPRLLSQMRLAWRKAEEW